MRAVLTGIGLIYTKFGNRYSYLFLKHAWILRQEAQYKQTHMGLVIKYKSTLEIN